MVAHSLVKTTPRYRRGLYPDVMAIAGEPVFHEHRPDEVLNPCLIVEVLSPSTASYERGDKFLYYRLESVGVTFEVGEIYAGVNFALAGL